MFSLDILREIFNYLDPLEYRIFRQVNKSCLKASNNPLEPFIYYEGVDINSSYWKLKLDRLGTCKAFILTEDSQLELKDGMVIIQIVDSATMTYIFSIDDQGFFSHLRIKILRRGGTYPNVRDIREIRKGIMHLPTLMGMFGNFFGIGFSLYKFGINYDLSGCLKKIVAEEDDIFVKICEIHGDYEIKRIGKWANELPIIRHVNDHLIYLPACLSKEYISVKGNNLQEIIDNLPLHLNNCWSKEKAGEQVEYLLTRLDFLLVCLVRNSDYLRTAN